METPYTDTQSAEESSFSSASFSSSFSSSLVGPQVSDPDGGEGAARDGHNGELTEGGGRKARTQHGGYPNPPFLLQQLSSPWA